MPIGLRRTSQSVLIDVSQRLPATLELITLSGLVSVLVGIPIGVWTAVRRKGIIDRVLFGYGMLAGSVPDFWLGLILIFVFFSLLGWVPGPIGQLDPIVDAPPRVTGMIALDALLSGQWDTLQSALAHPVRREAVWNGIRRWSSRRCRLWPFRESGATAVRAGRTCRQQPFRRS